MKKFAALLLFCLSFLVTSAQQNIEKTFNFSGKNLVKLKIQIADSINIQTWEKNEVLVKASININDNKDNEAYNTSFSETGNAVLVEANFKNNYFKGNKNCCNQTIIYWQVFVPAKTELNVETINANINITGNMEAMRIKSISGYIDLAVPVNQKADLELSTISGTIYSNHELALNKVKAGVHSKIEEKLNEGGALIKLETISGDIFFRKSNM